MKKNHPNLTGQLGFAALPQESDTANRARKIEKETTHLPKTMAEALLFYRALIGRHHGAMLAVDVDEARSRGPPESELT